MRKLLLPIFLLAMITHLSRIYAATFTWDGTTSDWNTASNWMVGMMAAMSVPGPGDDVIINDPNDETPILPVGGTTINSITITNMATLNMAGETLELLGLIGSPAAGLFLDGATIQGAGSFLCIVIEELANTTFEDNIAITKLGSAIMASNVLSGGNTFQGTFTFRQESGASSTVFANSDPDEFNQPVQLVNLSDDPIDMAYASASPTLFNDDVILESDANGGIRFGDGGGTSTLSGALNEGLVLGFSIGDLIIRNLTQTGNFPNGGFVTINFEVENSTLLGGISVLAISGMRLVNSTFASQGASNFFTSTNLEEVSNCDFSLLTGMTLLEQIVSSSDNSWSGGNHFGDVEIINTSSGDLQLATVSPDNYDGDVFFDRSAMGVLEPAFAGNNTFAGDISTDGDINFGVGGGTVIIDGETDQTLTVSSGTVTLDKLTVDQPSPNTFTPSAPITINTTLTLTSGILVSSSATANIILENMATASPGNDNSYVDGKLKKIGNQAFTFPVGDGGFIAPIGISKPNNPNSEFTVEYFYQTPPNNMSIGGGSLDHVSSLEYWTLSGMSNIQVTLSWDARSGPVNQLIELVVARFTGGVWSSLGQSAVTGTTGSGTVTSSMSVSSTNTLTLGSTTISNPLPVELLYFTAEAEDNRVRLDWATASELNHAAFHIERSADGETFEAVHKEPGDGRDRFETKTYRWYDENPLPGISYYRLRQIDVDGTVDFSGIRSVVMPAGGLPALRIYPNPAAEVLRLSSEEDLSVSDIRLFNAAGQEVALQPVIGEKEVDIPVASLAAGVYVLQIRHKGRVTAERVVIGR